MESPVLHIRLFGDLELRYGETFLPSFESTRAETLLAYLLLNRDAPQPRQRIAFLLWPDSSESQARTNLRHLLHTLRGSLPDSERFIDVTPRTLQWRVDSPYWLDIAEFGKSIDEADGREAVELYRGDLLEGCYDEWLLEEREKFRRQYLQTLEQLARSLEVSGDYSEAIFYACQIQRYDPLYEETYRLLMRLHNASGDRARAVRIYHECATTLERELGVEPSRPTREAYEALLAGKTEPPVLQEHRAQIRSPLVGRASEWKQLTDCWHAAENAPSRFVLVSGEAGIGKTRLVEEFRAWCDQRGALVAEARSYAAEGALSYGPVVDWLRSDPLKMRRSRLDQTSLSVLARLLPEIHNEYPNLPTVELFSENDQRQRQFGALAGALHAANMPLLLIIDDIHWSDRETLQFLHFLLRTGAHARLLVVATARREEVDGKHPLNDLLASLQAIERLTEIELERLTRQETATLAETLTGQSFAEPRTDRLFDETEGNPLFVVETLQAGWASGQVGDGWISPRVQAVIESRLIQVSEPARELIGVAATIGREFTAALLGRASAYDDDTLVRALDELWRRRIVREQDVDAYDFAHDKIREVAYLALGPARRRHYHLQVARALEHLHGDDPAPVSGQLAMHYERAGAIDQAVDWYVRAAGMAQQLHANTEAIRLYEHARDLLVTLPETRERLTRELAILTALPAPLVAVEGYFASRVVELHERALQITGKLGIEPAPPLLRSLALANLSHYEFEAAQRFGEQLRAHGEREDDAVLIAQSGYVLGIAAFWQGEFHLARQHFETAVKNCRPEDRPAHFLHYGHDPESTCLMRLGCTLWFLGHPVEAARARDAALALVDEVNHPYSRRLVLMFAAVLALEMRDTALLREHVTEMLAPGIEEEAIHIRGTIEVFAGHVEVLDGQFERGIACIVPALDDPTSYEQAPGQIAMFLRVLLEACLVASDIRTGLAASERLLLKNKGVRLWDAEAHRFRAEFMAALDASNEDITRELEQALAIARRQGARSLELRAATSLLRHHLASDNGRAAARARIVLREICDTLVESHDTPDMRAAITVLSQTSTLHGL
ncbi:AAA family ATPase [soil metagenome]